MKTAKLCWGQRYMWLRFHQLPPAHRHETHVVLRLGVHEGITLANCRATLTYLARRHEALRTTFHLDGDGDPYQKVDPPGPVRAVEVTTERDGTPSPAEVVEDLSSRPFDLETEWPIRACVITSGGVPKQMVVVLNHLAVDVWTIGELKRELRMQRAGFASRRPAAIQPVRHQPADLARYESSAEAAVTAARAVAHWENEIAQLPYDLFATRRARPDGPPARHATLISHALLAASRELAAAHQAWPSLIHLTAYTATMAAYTGSETVGHLSFVGNRDSHPYGDVLTCMFSPTLVRVDCSGDPTFGELLTRVAAAFARAREHAYLPYDEVVELLSREGSRRAHPVRLASEFNFIKQASREYKGARTAYTTNPVPEAWARTGTDTYVRVDEWKDAVAISLHAAASVMDGEAVERFLRGFESVLLAARDDAFRLSDATALAAFPPAGAPTPSNASGHAGASGHASASGRGGASGHAAARPYTEISDADPAAEQDLAEIVRQVNGLRKTDLTRSYTLAGGRALRIPRVLAELGTQGWTGLDVCQLAGPTPLRALARRLVPLSTQDRNRLGVVTS
ncbi:condensation domain-containing protein [Nonomuraea sp. NPDC050790]|uniref:condensation domain-containing protein n=1 Tax=Nonomuraea sp. NPDC050790 TaxID=3364371 RepID=UPI00378CF44F